VGIAHKELEQAPLLDSLRQVALGRALMTIKVLNHP